MARQAPKGFDAAFFLGAGRSYFRDGEDVLKQCRTARLKEHDFIPRTTTTASIVIEGVGPGDAPDAGMMWCAVGYTPCCYAIPAWVAAGEELPAAISGKAPANQLAVRLFGRIHEDSEVEVSPLRRIIRSVTLAERREMRAGRRLQGKVRAGGIRPEDFRKYNQSAEARFRRFQDQMQ